MLLSMSVVAALSTPETTVMGAAISALFAGAVALVLNALTRRRADRNRRRDLYSEAYRTALEWCEGVYRVRRRAPDGADDRELVAHFHSLQERIAYYQGWLCIEAADLGRAYQHFLDQVMAECRPLLQAAWEEPGRLPTAATPPDEKTPELSQAKERFLRDVRQHLAAPWETV
jgi:hypothetical protein